MRCKNRDGAVSVELALIASLVLLPMTIGAVDAAQIITTRARLDQALHEAMFYAWANGGSVTASAVQTTAASASAPQPSVTASITQYCITPATGYPSSGSPNLPNNGSCSNGQSLESYLSVTASASVTLFFTGWVITSPTTLSVTGQARIK